jgi:dihydroflavonol-4-reductase
VGGALCARLIGEGREVTALARSDGSAAKLETMGARVVRGDVLDETSLADVMTGCRVAYHAAGQVGMCLPDPAPMYRLNVDGSVNVVRAAAASGVRRVIHTSSAVTIGEPAGTVATEDTPHRGHYLCHYERSKHEAEQAVLAEGERLGIEVVSVNPASVQGPGRTGGTARLLIGYLNRTLRWAFDATLSLVFVDDCTEAHLGAEQKGDPGRRYLVSGVTCSVGELAELLAKVAGVDRRIHLLPRWVARFAAAAVGGAYRLIRRRAPLCSENARMVLHGPAYDGSRAARELGFSYTPLEEWLRCTVDWYRAEGLVG